MQDYRILLTQALLEALPDTQVSKDTIYKSIEAPKESGHGDLAFPCFILAKELKQSPAQIAQSLQLLVNTKLPKGIEKAQAMGPYLNFYFDKGQQAQQVVTDILAQGQDYGKIQSEHPITYAVEYPGPNTNKPLHLGHARIMFLGKSISTLLEATGNKVYHVNINNDRGVHICKSMLAYKLFGNDAQPDKKSDHYVGDWYVRYQQEADKNPELEQQVQEMLQAWEQGDAQVRELWHKMRAWALDGFKESYDKFGIAFDKEYFESDFYDKARDIVLQFHEKGIFKKRDDGAIIATFDDKLPEKVLLRPNGTTVYITQDIYLARQRHEDFNMDALVYIVGNEQILHFQQLFTILKQMDEPYADNCHHLATGMIALPSGKMKSREGTVVDTDDMFDNLKNIARQAIEERHANLETNEITLRSTAIANAAFRFFIFKHNPKADFIFDPDQSVAFEGETGPYIQYTYARLKSILRKADKQPQADLSLLVDPAEVALIEHLTEFPQVITNAATKMAPYLLCQHLIRLSQASNSFYHACHIMDAPQDIKAARLALVTAAATVIKNGLSLLNIDVLEEM